MAAHAPVRIGHYKLRKTLGIGSFGKVKLAEHEPTGRLVAIKIMNRKRISKLRMSEKVRREIKILRMFRHPHIIREYEVIDTPTDIFVVMEHVSGGELFDYIVQRGRLSELEARRFFQQIISGVEHCHFHHVTHRDLKPENLLLDADDNVKIADFGLANVMQDGEFLHTSCGSPNYAAPEVISGSMYAGPEVDVWSCGVILYALLCGSLPFDDESIPNLFKKIKSGVYTLPSHLSPLSRDLIPRMLVTDPMRRITIADIRKHPWFRESLPPYLQLTPRAEEAAEVEVDEEVMANVCALGIAEGVPAEVVLAATKLRNGNPFRVAYDLLYDHQQSQKLLAERRIADKRAQEKSVAFSPLALSADVSIASDLSRPGMSPPSPTTLRLPPSAQSAAALRASARGRRRRWYLGIQSKKDPGLVMTEVYRALRALHFDWKILSPYRVRCRWQASAHADMRRKGPVDDGAAAGAAGTTSPTAAASNTSGSAAARGLASPVMPFAFPSSEPAHKQPDGPPSDGEGEVDLGAVMLGLQLYRVQESIYLLDFQKVQGDAFSFMSLCSRIIIELQRGLSARAAAAPTPSAAMSGLTAAGGQADTGGGNRPPPHGGTAMWGAPPPARSVATSSSGGGEGAGVQYRR